MLIYSILSTLNSNAVINRRDKSILYARILISNLACCFLISLNGYFSEFHAKGVGLFGGTYHTSAITNVFQMFIFLIVGLIIQLNGFYPRKAWTEYFSSLPKLLFYKFVYYSKFILNRMSEQFRILEYPLVILFTVIGGIFLLSSCDLISVFLSIELQSYGLYILCAIYRNSERATSGALTYFLLGGLGSCFILLGSGLIYSNSGNASFDGLYVINNITVDIDTKEGTQSMFIYLTLCFSIMFSLVIMSTGFLFKASAAPFHFWSPDVYDAIPTIVTTFVAIFAKISIFILLLELVHYTSNFLSFNMTQELASENDNKNILFNYSWTFTLLISSLLSLIIGSVLGLTQFRIKRLYAYSTISHIGFILLALTINSIESIQSFIFYLMQYSLSNLNAFMLLITIGYSLYFYTEKNDKKSKLEEQSETEDKSLSSNIISDKNYSPIQLVSQLKGYFYINPFISTSLALTLFSFAGIPPLIGFFAKQMVLSSALDNGYIFMTLIAILTSVISAYYYLVIVKQMFFFKTDYILNPVLENITIKGNIFNKISKNYIEKVNLKIENISLSSSLSINISILTLMILFFLLTPKEWLSLANILAFVLFNC